MDFRLTTIFHVLAVAIMLKMATLVNSQDVVGCGGFVQSEVEINYSLIEVCQLTQLYSHS